MPQQVENLGSNGVSIPIADAKAREDIAALNASLTQLQGTFHDGGEKTCEVNTSGLLNLSTNFSIPANARDINVVVINDTAVATSAVYWTNSQWYVFILVVGTGNTIERRPSTSTKVRCTWRTP